jgi:hypothetical protein
VEIEKERAYARIARQGPIFDIERGEDVDEFFGLEEFMADAPHEEEGGLINQAQLAVLLALWYLRMVLMPGSKHDPIATLSSFEIGLLNIAHFSIFTVSK